jgi:hypothetical protein
VRAYRHREFDPGKQYEEHFVKDRGPDGCVVIASASDAVKKIGSVEFAPVS